MAFEDKNFNHKHLSQIKCLEGVMKEKPLRTKASGFYEEPSEDEPYSYNSLSTGDAVLIPICKGVRQYIKTFEEELDENHEIAILLGAYGDTGLIRLHSIGSCAPELITLHGVSLEGEVVQLIQVISQFNILLKAIKKKNEIPSL